MFFILMTSQLQSQSPHLEYPYFGLLFEFGINQIDFIWLILISDVNYK